VGFFWRFRVHGEGRSLCFKKFDSHLVVPAILGTQAASAYHLRKAGQKKSATLEFLKQGQRLVMAPRTASERRFAWANGYFGRMYFQTWRRIK
jgi:hypothetical protein